jgi:hypothetical protein
MKTQETLHLINIGATDQVRARLKKLAIEDRMKTLKELIPIVTATPETLSFFRKNFSAEIGAVIMADDVTAAAKLYRASKKG